jgi:osmotically-inducible protein OsmY
MVDARVSGPPLSKSARSSASSAGQICSAVLARPDEVVEAELRDHIGRDLAMLDGSTISIEVDDGVVTLDGTVPTRTDTSIIETVAGHFGGVVSVVSHPRYEVDEYAPSTAARVAGAARPNW